MYKCKVECSLGIECDYCMVFNVFFIFCCNGCVQRSLCWRSFRKCLMFGMILFYLFLVGRIMVELIFLQWLLLGYVNINVFCLKFQLFKNCWQKCIFFEVVECFVY